MNLSCSRHPKLSAKDCSHHKKVYETQTDSCTSRTETIEAHRLSRLRFCLWLVFKFSAIPFSIAVYKLEVRGVKKCFDEHSRSSPRHLGIHGWCPTCNRAPFRTLASSLQLCSVPRTCTFSNVLSTHIASSRTLPSLPPSYPLVWGTTIFLLTLKFVLMILTLHCSILELTENTAFNTLWFAAVSSQMKAMTPSVSKESTSSDLCGCF